MKGVDEWLKQQSGDKKQAFNDYLDRIDLAHKDLARATKWCQKWKRKLAAKTKGTVVTTPFSEIKLESAKHVWKGRVPTRMLTCVMGDPGEGKTTIVCSLAAQATRGQLAGDDAGQPVGVCICSAEDSPAHTLGPRLAVAGADMTRVHLMEFRDQNQFTRGVLFPDDCAAIRTRMEATGSKILIVDPLVAHLPPELNSWRDQDIRRALDAMKRLAEELDAAIIFLSHLNKNSSAPNPLYRLSNSIAISAAARSILWAAQDPTDESAKVLVHIKANVAEKAPTLRYCIESHLLADNIKTSKIVWAGEAPAITADDLMQQPSDKHEPLGAGDEAKLWLEGIIGPEGKEASFILKEAEKVGIAKRTLDRAKKALGVKPQFHGKSHHWLWVLPSKTKGSEGRNLVSQPVGNLALKDKKLLITSII
ncbi:MAG: AAA family ATPase [Nitrospira sp.]|nr:AAA family ATPase [Nitrospira sp.]